MYLPRREDLFATSLPCQRLLPRSDPTAFTYTFREDPVSPLSPGLQVSCGEQRSELTSKIIGPSLLFPLPTPGFFRLPHPLPPPRGVRSSERRAQASPVHFQLVNWCPLPSTTSPSQPVFVFFVLLPSAISWASNTIWGDRCCCPRCGAEWEESLGPPVDFRLVPLPSTTSLSPSSLCSCLLPSPGQATRSGGIVVVARGVEPSGRRA